MRQAEDMLEEAVLGLIAHGEEVPEPALATEGIPRDATRRAPVALPALTAAKLELYRAMRQAGLDKAQLAARLGWTSKQITHLFDGYHAVRLEQLEAALATLGRRLVVSSEAAAIVLLHAAVLHDQGVLTGVALAIGIGPNTAR